MMRPHFSRRILFLFGTLVFSAACSSKPTYELVPGEFEVSVKADGKAVSNHEQKLVHRVELAQKDLDQVMSTWPERLNIPFSSEAEKDVRGDVVGLRLSWSGSALPTLGLQDGDVLTAVGKRHAQNLRDLSGVIFALENRELASVTIERQGQPHKLLYYLKSDT